MSITHDVPAQFIRARDLTDGLLGYNFGVTVAMGNSPPKNIQNGGRSGGECLSGTWRVHFDDESLRGGGYIFFC